MKEWPQQSLVMYLEIMSYKKFLRKVSNWKEYLYITGNESYKIRMFNKLKGQLGELSKNPYGCRVIQKIVDFVKY